MSQSISVQVTPGAPQWYYELDSLPTVPGMNIEPPAHKTKATAPVPSPVVTHRQTKPGPTTLIPELTYTKKDKEQIKESQIYDAVETASVGSEMAISKISASPSGTIWKKPIKDTTVTEGRINVITQVDSDKEALCCKYSEDYEYIAAGYTNGIIKIYQSSNGEHVYTLSDGDIYDTVAPVTNIKHRPVSKAYPISNCFTATYANGCVKCWSYNFNQCLYTIRENRQTYGITYHPRFPKFVTFGDDQKICFYDEESKIQERVLMPSEIPITHDGHMSRIFAACFHPQNMYEFISGGWDDVVQFWDLRQPFAIRHLSNIHICGEGLDINATGTEVLTCSYQKTEPLQIFDYGSGKRISCFEPDIYTSKLYCGRYGIREFVFSGGADPNILRVIDLQTTTTTASINYLPGAVYALDLGPRKSVKKEKENRARLKSDVCLLPKLIFVSGRRLYQVDFI